VNTFRFLSWKVCGAIWAINAGIALGTDQMGTAMACFAVSFLCFYISSTTTAAKASDY
jgi:hypothetical protein